jgi:hypothetical protein
VSNSLMVRSASSRVSNYEATFILRDASLSRCSSG